MMDTALSVLRCITIKNNKTARLQDCKTARHHEILMIYLRLFLCNNFNNSIF
jgi:hypothetical protein